MAVQYGIVGRGVKRFEVCDGITDQFSVSNHSAGERQRYLIHSFHKTGFLPCFHSGGRNMAVNLVVSILDFFSTRVIFSFLYTTWWKISSFQK